MQKPLSLSLAVALTLTGCTAFKKSVTWEKVIETRTQRTAEATGSQGYQDRLHKVLASDNVEHKIVTYQYRYRTAMREEAVGTGTAVIYRDTSTPSNPWWLMDERLGSPVWLPNEKVDRQVQFYLRRDAQVVAQQEFPASGEPRSIITNEPAAVQAPLVAKVPAKPAPTKRPDFRVKRPLFPEPVQIAETKPQPARIVPVKVQPAPVAVARVTSESAPGPITRIQPPAPLTTRIAAASPSTETPLITRLIPSARPARFAPSQRWAESTVPVPQLSEVFRSAHGTNYDPASLIDRHKMTRLRDSLELQDHDYRSF